MASIVTKGKFSKDKGIRGQITVFMIIGILVVAIAIVLSLQYQKKATMPQTDTPGLQQYLQACFENGVKTSLLYVEHVGDERLHPDKIQFGDYDVSLLVKGANAQIPSLDILEAGLEKSLISQYSECKPELRFPYEIFQDFDSAQAQAIFREDQAVFTIDVPSRAKIAGQESTAFGKHVFILPTRFMAMHQKALEIADSLAKSPGTLPLNELSSDIFQVYVYPFDDGTFIIRLVDPEQSIGEVPQAYTFGVSRQ